jgi:hypothetical protein
MSRTQTKDIIMFLESFNMSIIVFNLESFMANY